jgi:hypothetical protein
MVGRTWLAECGNIKNTVGQSTNGLKQKMNKQKRMESGVPVFEMSPNKVQKRAIGQGKDKEQRNWVAKHGNIKNKGGRSKNLQDQMKTVTNWLHQRQSVVQNTSSSMQNDWNHPRNMLEQAAKETIEKCSQEVDQTDSRVYRLLTRSENKKRKDSVSV